MTKYEQALCDVWNKLDDTEEINEALLTLQELEEKFYNIGCELSNIPYLDNECKLKTLEIIQRIYYGE